VENNHIQVKAILKKGFTLVEVMIVSCLVTVLLGALISLYVQGGYDFTRGFSCLEIHGDARISMDWLAKDLKEASQIITSGAHEIVFEVPSDSGGNPIEGAYDRITYRVNTADTTKLERIVVANSSSSRQSEDRIIAKNIMAVDFTYNNSNVTKVTLVGLSLTTGKTILGNKLYQETLKSIVKLRNKAL